MASDIRDFLSLRRIAVVGVSRNPRSFSRMVFRALAERGYDLAPVNPGAPEIEGRPCFASVGEVTPAVEGALVMTSPDAAEAVLHECAAAGIHFVWLLKGKARRDGMRLIANECPFMFLPHPGWIHSFHRGVRQVFGTLPQ